jgi:hypothetical protein
MPDQAPCGGDHGERTGVFNSGFYLTKASLEKLLKSLFAFTATLKAFQVIPLRGNLDSACLVAVQ